MFLGMFSLKRRACVFCVKRAPASGMFQEALHLVTRGACAHMFNKEAGSLNKIK